MPVRNFKLLAVFCGCTARFVSNLFGNHIVDWFSHDTPHFTIVCACIMYRTHFLIQMLSFKAMNYFLYNLKTGSKVA